MTRRKAIGRRKRRGYGQGKSRCPLLICEDRKRERERERTNAGSKWTRFFLDHCALTGVDFNDHSVSRASPCATVTAFSQV